MEPITATAVVAPAAKAATPAAVAALAARASTLVAPVAAAIAAAPLVSGMVIGAAIMGAGYLVTRHVAAPAVKTASERFTAWRTARRAANENASVGQVDRESPEQVLRSA